MWFNMVWPKEHALMSYIYTAYILYIYTHILNIYCIYIYTVYIYILCIYTVCILYIYCKYTEYIVTDCVYIYTLYVYCIYTVYIYTEYRLYIYIYTVYMSNIPIQHKTLHITTQSSRWCSWNHHLDETRFEALGRLTALGTSTWSELLRGMLRSSENGMDLS